MSISIESLKYCQFVSLILVKSCFDEPRYDIIGGAYPEERATSSRHTWKLQEGSIATPDHVFADRVKLRTRCKAIGGDTSID